MKKSKKAGLILTVGAALFLAAGAPALADETDTISKNVYIGGVNVSGMTEEQAHRAIEKQAMDTRQTRVAVAQTVIDHYDE